MKNTLTLEDLKEEIKNIRKEKPLLKESDAFVYWFMLSYLVGIDQEKLAQSSLTGKEGGSGGEKNIDAI